MASSEISGLLKPEKKEGFGFSSSIVLESSTPPRMEAAELTL